MFFFFTVGMQNFPSLIKGFESLKVYCPRCHNISMEARKDKKFFTFCYIPVVPVSFSKNLSCPICGYEQGTTVEQLEVIRNQQQSGPAGSSGGNGGYNAHQQQYQYPQQQSYQPQAPFNGQYNAPPPYKT